MVQNIPTWYAHGVREGRDVQIERTGYCVVACRELSGKGCATGPIEDEE